MPEVTCEGAKPSTPIKPVQLDTFWLRAGSAQEMISGWFRRGLESYPGGSVFESFVYTWIAFNGWAERVTTLEQDRDWIEALGYSQRLREDFAWTLAHVPRVESAVVELTAYAPIFKAVRQRAVPPPPPGSRRAQVNHWLGLKVAHRPICFELDGDRLQPDWPHLLHAIYQIRCNLFHGEKAASLDTDVQLVTWALNILQPFLQTAGYLGLQRRAPLSRVAGDPS